MNAIPQIIFESLSSCSIASSSSAVVFNDSKFCIASAFIFVDVLAFPKAKDVASSWLMFKSVQKFLTSSKVALLIKSVHIIIIQKINIVLIGLSPSTYLLQHEQTESRTPYKVVLALHCPSGSVSRIRIEIYNSHRKGIAQSPLYY